MADNISIKDATGTTKTVATHELTTDTAHASKVVMVDTNERLAGIDASTWSIQTIDYVHHEVHSGSSYHCGEVLNLNGTSWYTISTGNTDQKWTHIVFDVIGTADVEVELFETTTHPDGTPMTVHNRNRNLANSNEVAVTTGSAATGADGTSIYHNKSGQTGSGAQADTGGGAGSRNEWVLKQNTVYGFKITTTSTQDVTVHFNWYEHTNKETIS